jgi:hypothetical protein
MRRRRRRGPRGELGGHGGDRVGQRAARDRAGRRRVGHRGAGVPERHDRVARDGGHRLAVDPDDRRERQRADGGRGRERDAGVEAGHRHGELGQRAGEPRALFGRRLLELLAQVAADQLEGGPAGGHRGVGRRARRRARGGVQARARRPALREHRGGQARGPLVGRRGDRVDQPGGQRRDVGALAQPRWSGRAIAPAAGGGEGDGGDPGDVAVHRALRGLTVPPSDTAPAHRLPTTVGVR